MRYQRILRWFFVAVLGLVISSAFLPWKSALAQQVHKNSFETFNTSWIKGPTDVPFDELTHTMTDQGAHDGKRSEWIKINAQASNPVQNPDTPPHIYYQYATAHAPISIELSASIWVKANRPGPQLLARVVLPNERDPTNLDAHLATLLPGEVYRTVGRWQRLELGRPVQLAKQQQLIMQATLKRPINFEGAYVDALILNVYAGPGPTEVWIDDLEIGPVIPGTAPAPVDPGKKGRTPGLPVSKNAVPLAITRSVDFNGTQLLLGGKPFFFHGIRFTDTDLQALRRAGFNSVFVDYKADPKILREAVDLGFVVVPMLGVMAQDSRLATADGVRQEMIRFSDSDALLFWHLGGTLAFEQAATVAQVAQFMKNIDPGRPLGADVWDGLLPYSRSLQLLGIHRWPLMTTLELPRYRAWLDQRRGLANPGVFLWTWIQTHVPDWYTYLLYNQSGSVAFKEPIGPQPEQIRLLTYTALGAGCKGLGFWSDRFLADSHLGQDRLLCLALLNQELDMLEPLVTSAQDDQPQWIDTSSPNVKAAVLRTGKGILVLPIWQGPGSQFVPGQAAESKLTIVVPQVPQSHRAWEVTPADLRGLHTDRVLGGTRVTIREFGLTAAIVFTSDFTSENSIVGRFQTQARLNRQSAAQWSYDMAQVEMKKVIGIEEQLEKQGHYLPDGKQLMDDAQTRLEAARRYWDNRLFNEAYLESQRALRPLRILMRAQWDQAVSECLGPKKGLDSPASSPFAVSFFTLPRHWDFMDQVRRSVPAANVLPGGDFEVDAQRVQDTWRLEEPRLDEVEMVALPVSEVRVPMTVKPASNTPPDTGAGKSAKPTAPPTVKPASNTPPDTGAGKSAKLAAPPTTVEKPKHGKQCLKLEIKPKAGVYPQKALERAMLALTSPVVHLQPGTLVQVSGWVRIPQAITASPDGALIFDSAGGEPLAIRLTQPIAWKKFTLYRRVPDSGTMYVTLALTGLGTVYFDDVRIEPLVPENQVAVGGQQ